MAQHERPDAIDYVIRYTYLIWDGGDESSTFLETAHYRCRTMLGAAFAGWTIRPRHASKSSPQRHAVTVTVRLDDPDAERLQAIRETLGTIFALAPSLPQLELWSPTRTTIAAGTPEGFKREVGAFLREVVGEENVEENVTIGPEEMAE